MYLILSLGVNDFSQPAVGELQLLTVDWWSLELHHWERGSSLVGASSAASLHFSPTWQHRARNSFIIVLIIGDLLKVAKNSFVLLQQLQLQVIIVINTL
jgi:hypothetical protein